MKIKPHVQAAKLFGVFVLISGLMLGIMGAGNSPARAVGSYNNALIADKALTYVGQWGGNACRDAGKPQSGQCKQFVNCIVFMVSGGSQYPVPGYNEGFQTAGGVEVSGASAIKGDIIQVGNSDSASPLHTAIVVKNLGDGRFDVVDSNFAFDEKVQHHVYDPPTGARFWRMGKNLSGMPFGHFDILQRAPGGARIAGWAIDPNAANGGKGAIRVDTYGGTGSPGGGNPGKALTANLYRGDVGNAYPKYGSYHGYDGTIGLRYGSNKVCSYAIDVGLGSNKQIGCKSINISPDPFGSLDIVKPVDGGVQVSGWAIDPDTASPIRVDTYGGDGGAAPGVNPGRNFTADASRPDVKRVYPNYGDLHGYAGFFPLKSGQQTVCAYAINASGTTGANKKIGCKTVTVP